MKHDRRMRRRARACTHATHLSYSHLIILTSSSNQAYLLWRARGPLEEQLCANNAAHKHAGLRALLPGMRQPTLPARLRASCASPAFFAYLNTSVVWVLSYSHNCRLRRQGRRRRSRQTGRRDSVRLTAMAQNRLQTRRAFSSALHTVLSRF